MPTEDKATAIWLTGLPATGKSTIARALQKKLLAEDVSCAVLDSDELRSVLTPSAKYDEHERDVFYATVAALAAELASSGVVVIVAATAPKRTYRDALRTEVDDFYEILLRCDDALLEGRDPKGLYAKANAGLITNLPGRGGPYEPPLDPRMTFDTGAESLEDITNAIFLALSREREADVATNAIHPNPLRTYLRRIGYPGAKITSLTPLGGDVQEGLKAHGYGQPLRVRFVSGDTEHSLVLRTMGADKFGHDRRADRFDGLALAFDTFRQYPEHVEPIDLGVITPGGALRSCGSGEPFLLTTYVDGELYAHDLTRLGKMSEPDPGDLERASKLAEYLAMLHEKPGAKASYRRAVRDLVGHGEGFFGLVDAFGPDDEIATPRRLQALEHAMVDWRWRLQKRSDRARRTHGDFHPFNLLFREGTDLTVLDASRGGVGDPADDVTCLSINYLFFAMTSNGRFDGALRHVWDTFWSIYRAKTNDDELFDFVAPFFAWRSLVLVCPEWYPNVDPRVRGSILRLAERLLAGHAFRPDAVDALID